MSTVSFLLIIRPILNVPMWVQLLAVIFGAISGTIVGRRSEFDLAGLVALAIATGLGGGMLRDILLQHGTPVALSNNAFILTATVTGVVGALAPTTIAAVLTRIRWPFTVLDAMFVAIYATTSTEMATNVGLPAVPCIFVGVIGGVGGSILRDVFANEQPEIFRPGTLYAVPTAIGVTVYVAILRLTTVGSWSAIVPIVLIVTMRMVAVWRGWSLSEAAEDVYLFAQIRTRIRNLPMKSKRREP